MIVHLAVEGRWNDTETQKYRNFCFKHAENILEGHRADYGFYQLMAKEIGTRSESQCKSHHQKARAQIITELKLKQSTPDEPSPNNEVAEAKGYF